MSDPFIIVTGASRGIGAEIALGLARSGFQVGCLSRSGELPRLDDVPDEVRVRWHAAACDVGDPAQIAQAFEAMARLCDGRLAGLVNNAGLHTDGDSASLPPEAFNNLLHVNATSVLMASQAAYPLLRANGGGLIINMGSFYDKLGVKQNTAYCASKAAVGAITRCLAVEWANDGIQAVNIAPGYVVTDLNREFLTTGPLARHLQKRIPRHAPAQAHEVADLVVSLALLKSRFLTGETIYLDGGQPLAV
ncbi:SDR family oxidoreductase [Verticiella sediminum]|uniref:SDR family oxidoreductase n=1 Tax=Verticiella sediminum TaxID=1247510 RepID=A0A556AJ68_9BURK|nr:SDR family oxidoreductase [Verticiella sediminum]TSH92916.1 SDR family oxidoreductase [Verticiella sediminum]